MDVCVGDRVQIVDGGMDVTNGLHAKSGKMYGQGGPLWATVVLIDTAWKTGGKFGLPSVVTKVRCAADNDVIVWQVQPQDIAPNIIHSSQPETVQTEPDPLPKEPAPTEQGKVDLTPTTGGGSSKFATAVEATGAYAPAARSNTWTSGVSTGSKDTIGRPDTYGATTKVISNDALTVDPVVRYDPVTPLTDEEKATIGPDIPMTLPEKAHFTTAWENQSKRMVMLNEDIYNHQNDYQFPKTDYSMRAQGGRVRQYDFQIIPGDSKLPMMVSLEDKLRDFRAAVGIPVHGSNEIARTMKYFMYNRFKVPDTNLLHNKSVTYVFFSRPDLNILNGLSCASQCLQHSEAAMMWRRYPELFKLLVDSSRVGDENNFNMLLSNQVTSFDVRDEELNTNDVGKSWREYTIPYAEAYTGRTSGEFTCNFNETSDYSVINLIKLWVTYIDNVASGAWSPSYHLTSRTRGISGINLSHVFTKTLDYAASAYIFKCGPDGEDILFWSKYYGIYPVSTGSGALSWDNDTPIGTGPKLNIRFKYAWKKDMSPISLLEFNDLACITGSAVSENAFNKELAHSARPFVGTPFIEIDLGTPILVGNGIASQKRTGLRLKFKPTTVTGMNDNAIYRASHTPTFNLNAS